MPGSVHTPMGHDSCPASIAARSLAQKSSSCARMRTVACNKSSSAKQTALHLNITTSLKDSLSAERALVCSRNEFCRNPAPLPCIGRVAGYRVINFRQAWPWQFGEQSRQRRKREQAYRQYPGSILWKISPPDSIAFPVRAGRPPAVVPTPVVLLHSRSRYHRADR